MASGPESYEAFEEWSESRAARDAYESDLDDGLVPASRYTRDGVGVDHQPFEDWLSTSPRADIHFDRWVGEEIESARDRYYDAIAEERGARF